VIFSPIAWLSLQEINTRANHDGRRESITSKVTTVIEFTSENPQEFRVAEERLCGLQGLTQVLDLLPLRGRKRNEFEAMQKALSMSHYCANIVLRTRLILRGQGEFKVHHLSRIYMAGDYRANSALRQLKATAMNADFALMPQQSHRDRKLGAIAGKASTGTCGGSKSGWRIDCQSHH
jgi:hypothetical protein